MILPDLPISLENQAHSGNRTRGLAHTRGVLCLLSYVGVLLVRCPPKTATMRVSEHRNALPRLGLAVLFFGAASALVGRLAVDARRASTVPACASDLWITAITST